MSRIETSPDTARYAQASPNATDLSLIGLSKVYGGTDVAAVTIDELKVHAGEFMTLVGPSGCGKSTTLRMVAGLEYPDSGDVYFGDRRMTDVPVQKRNVSMVFQNYALYPSKNVRQNLEYGLKKHNVPKDVIAARVEEISSLLGIENLLDRRPRQLSGGEQQRSALGRAIIRDPDVLLLDEPLSNLDARRRQDLRFEVLNVQRRIGCTTLYVTHDQLEAMTMSDRMAVMRAGRIEQLDTPKEVFNHPANIFVAQFIGNPAMNFVKGQLEVTDDAVRLMAGNGQRLTLQDPVLCSRLRGDNVERDVVLGVRPHDIFVGPDAASATAMRADVRLVQLIGAEQQVFLDSPLGQLTARSEVDDDLARATQVTFSFRESALHFFSESSGARLGVS